MSVLVPIHRGMRPSIRIAAFVDRAAADRGLPGIVASEHDLQLVGVACTKAELWSLLYRSHPMS